MYSPSFKPLTAEGLPTPVFCFVFPTKQIWTLLFLLQCIYQYPGDFSSMNCHPLLEHLYIFSICNILQQTTLTQLWAVWRTSTSIMAIYIQEYSLQQSRRLASIRRFVMSIVQEFERSCSRGNRSGCSKLFLEIICSSPASINNSLPA